MNASLSTALDPKQHLTGPGLVEIVNLYDHRYVSFFVDGTFVLQTYKESFHSQVISRQFIKSAVKISGVKEDALTFVSIDFETHADGILRATGGDYDANDYDDYSTLLDFCSAHPTPAGPRIVKVLATGVEALEAAIL